MTDGPTSVLPDEVPRWLYALRALPAWVRGKTRLARLLTRWAGMKGAAVVRAQGLRFAVPSLSEPVAQGLLRDGVYEAQTAEGLRMHLPPDGVLVDVGANVGVFSLLAAHQWVQAGRVLALEASPQIHGWLSMNAELNPAPNLTVVHGAVSNVSGAMVNFYNAPEAKFGMGALTNRFGLEAVEVRTVTLDETVEREGLGRVDVIKVDVEGHELEVFQGAVRALAQERAPVVLFEFNDWAENRGDGVRAGDAQRFLVGLGYRITRLQDYLKGACEGIEVMESGGADLIAWRP